MAQGKKDEAEELKKKVQENADRAESFPQKKRKLKQDKKIMMTIPNIIDPSVPIGKRRQRKC